MGSGLSLTVPVGTRYLERYFCQLAVTILLKAYRSVLFRTHPSFPTDEILARTAKRQIKHSVAFLPTGSSTSASVKDYFIDCEERALSFTLGNARPPPPCLGSSQIAYPVGTSSAHD